MSLEQILSPLKALADENRLKLVALLLTHNLCVGALAQRVGISEAAVSQHLRILRKAGLVRGEKIGYWTHYRVERDMLRQLAGGIGTLADKPSCPEGCCTLP